MIGFRVSDIWERAKKVYGSCDEHELFDILSYVVETLANTGEFDPLTAYVDLCVNEQQIVTLPRDVDTVLAVNIGGEPSVPRDQLYNFHLNGPGDCNVLCSWGWQDLGNVPTLRELSKPSKLVAFVERPEDAGKELWAYGLDIYGKEVRTEVDGTWVTGHLVPTIYGYALPASNAPTFLTITSVKKAETIGTIKLASFDYGVGSGTLLGVFQWNETLPSYRRIKLDRACTWCRIAYRKRIFKIQSQDDLIPLPSQSAFWQMMQAMKFYDEGDLERATAFEATARRWLSEAIQAHSTPALTPLQVNPVGTMSDSWDLVN